MTDHTNVIKIFKKLNISDPILLGKGGEGWIYSYGKDILKIYRENATKQYVENIQAFQTILTKQHFSFDVPQIYKIGEVDGILYTVEKRLLGIPMDKKIVGIPTSKRQQIYLNYYHTIQEVNAVSFSELPYGHIIKTPTSITSDNWTDYLVRILDKKAITILDSTKNLIRDFNKKMELIKSLITCHLTSTQKNLVHGDYYLNNVLVGNDLSITAVLDFSIHAVVGDPRLDIAGVLTWNEIDDQIQPEDYLFLYDRIKIDYGDDIQKYIDLYLLFSSFYFADMDDPSFSVHNLNNEDIWNKYK